MTMKYFYDCKTKEEAKEKYYDLCKRNHPDVGGSNEVMKDINRQYDEFAKYSAEQDLKSSQQHQYKESNYTFYGSGFGTYNSKYTDMQGREYASRFDRNTTNDIYEGIGHIHPIRAYIQMIMADNSRLKIVIKDLSGINESQANEVKLIRAEIEKIRKQHEKLKNKINKINKPKKRKKCEIEPNVENVIAL